MQPITFFMFLWRSLDRAAADTAHFFNLDVKTIVTSGALIIAGFLLHWKVRGAVDTKEELSKYVILVAAPFIVFLAGFFIYNAFRAPYLIYFDEFSKLATSAQQKIDNAESAKTKAERGRTEAEAKIKELEVKVREQHFPGQARSTIRQLGSQEQRTGATEQQAIALGLQQLYDDGQKLRDVLFNSDDSLSAQQANEKFASWREELRTYVSQHISVGKAQYVDGVASVPSMSYSGMKSVTTKDSKELLITHINARLARISELMKAY